MCSSSKVLTILFFTMVSTRAMPFTGPIEAPKPIPLPGDPSNTGRQTIWDISKTAGGTNVLLGQKGTVFKNDNHQVDVHGTIQKTFHPSGPILPGGGVEYKHLPTENKLFLNSQPSFAGSNQVNAGGALNLWKPDKQTSLDLIGSYQRQFGGLPGTLDPRYYGGVQFSHQFGH